MRVETPGGPWNVRLASRVFDEPRPLLRDSVGLLVLTYGFHAYALESRTGVLRWTRRSGTPFVAILGSPRLPHVILQSEVETFAVAPDGETVWRVAHSDGVTAAGLTGGQLVLTSFGGAGTALDAATGRAGDRGSGPPRDRAGGASSQRYLAPICGPHVDNPCAPKGTGERTVDNAIDRRAVRG